ncbi:hypothetical protein KY290_021467 [Solanum tuberosum]|uniref:Replication factor A C-terminal domain-containing protein n=1 Tax=Solanum tuberosum TaxID=4113 RepID=A0ABQ7V375_SOLTU|nr:hypothetical protein KY285_020369 [Solanum tuberosum]KAH0757974.1 hypothetical protein KY290_021467 [Solanum tuberosum]
MHWNLKVRVIRLWIVPDKFKPEIPYSLEMILQDEKGDRIHASLGKTVIKHFREILYELGVFQMNYFVIAPNIMKFKTTTHKHKLNFTVTTNVKEIQDPSFHMDIFNIRTFDKLTIHHNVDETKLLDVVGHVASYQPIQQIKQGDNNSYFINIVLEDDKLSTTLWGELADQIQPHLTGSAYEPLIVVCQLMKAHKFRENYSVRSCWYQTKIWINPNLPQPTEFKDRLISSCDYKYERLSQTSSQKHHSITDELSKGVVSFTYLSDLSQCYEESSFWIAAKIVCLELDSGWSYLACNNCITKVDTEGTKYYCKKCNSEVKSVIHRYRLQLSVMDGTAFISILLWNKETIQLLGKTAKELKEGLLEDEESSYPTELGDLMEKNFMFKILIKDSNINRKDNVYKVVNFTDDDTLLKEFCHPDLQDSLNKSLFEYEQSYDEDKLFETPIKSSISECGTLITEDVIDLTTKISTKSSKTAGKSTRHEIKDDLNVKQPSNKIRKVIKKEKNT